MVHRVRALLFDLDGTLVDSAEANQRAYSRALREFGVVLEADQLGQVAAGNQWRDFLPAILQRAAVEVDPAVIAQRKGELYRETLSDLRMNVGLLRLAASVGPQMTSVLVTTASGETVRAILQHLGASESFEHVITGDDVTRHKPDPEAYHLALARLQLDPRECLAFEDSDAGLASANAAGIAVVRVRMST